MKGPNATVSVELVPLKGPSTSASETCGPGTMAYDEDFVGSNLGVLAEQFVHCEPATQKSGLLVSNATFKVCGGVPMLKEPKYQKSPFYTKGRKRIKEGNRD